MVAIGLSVAIISLIILLQGCGNMSDATGDRQTVSGSDANWLAREFGGETVVYLSPGRKLEEITWKDKDDLWILSRTMREDEVAEDHVFEQKGAWGKHGKVVIREQMIEK